MSPPCNRTATDPIPLAAAAAAVHQGIARIWHARVLFYRFYFSVYASLFIHRGPVSPRIPPQFVARPTYYIIPRAVLQQRITTEFVFFSISRDADPLQETSSLQKRCNQVHDGHPTRQREMEFHRAVRQLSTFTFRKSPAAISPL